MHLFRISNQQADLFVSHINLKNKDISYTVRDKETGMLLEPPNKSKLTVTEQQVLFDGRPIPLGLAQFIEQTLHG